MKKLYPKKTYANKSITLVLFAFLLISSVYNSYGQVVVPFAPRTSEFTPTKTNYTVKGDFTMIGNTNLQLVGENYPNFENNSQNDMGYVDVDNDPNTWNSSSAYLDFSQENDADPNCSNIIYAGLYWTGRANTGDQTFEVTKMVPTGNTTTEEVTDNERVYNNQNISNTNYSLSISRSGGNNNRTITYVFTPSGSGDTVEFIYRHNGGDETVHVRVNNGPENLLLDDDVWWHNIDDDDAYLNTPYTIGNLATDGFKIDVTRLRRDGRNSNTNGSTSVYLNVTYNETVPEIVEVTKNFDKQKVSIKGPLAANYTELEAEGIQFPSGGQYDNMFAAYAEVTEYVQQNGIGNYFVADIALTEGNGGSVGYYGGWGMVIIYENSKMKWRDITVFDGYAYVEGGTASHLLDIDGFNATQNGDVNLKLGLMAGEGDIAINGEYFRMRRQDNGVYENLSYPGSNVSPNNATNFFNSAIVTGGNARNPNYNNNTGLDIVMFDIDNANNKYIDNNQTSTSFQYGSTQDTYVIFNTTFSVDAYIPEPEGVLTTSSTIPNTVQPGESVDYLIEIKNRGTEATNNTVITIPVPYTSFYEDLSITYSVNAPLSTTNVPVFNPNLGATGSIVWDIGTLPVPSNPDDVLATLGFTLTATTDCSLLVNPFCEPTISLGGSITGVGETSSVSFETQLIQGYETGECEGEPIPTPSVTTIDITNFDCSSYTAVRDFYFCNIGSTPIQTSQVSAQFPSASKFYNEYPVTESSIQYNASNPFPSTLGTSTYYAVPPGATDCYYQFTINVSDISSVPTVEDVTYCLNDTATPLTAIPSDAPASPSEFKLYYYVDNNPSTPAQTSITPSTSVAGETIYYVAEGYSNNCISSVRVPIKVTVYGEAPEITVPDTINIDGCDVSAINSGNSKYPYDADGSEDIKDSFEETGYEASDDGSIASITYTDVLATAVDTGCLQVTRTFTITDNCGDTSMAIQIINITAPEALVATAPADVNLPACATADEIQTAYNNWMAGFNVSGGCNPTDNMGDFPALTDLTCGGSINFTLNAQNTPDACTDSASASSSFNVATAAAITYTEPEDANLEACDFANQDAVDTAFTNWVNAQSAAIAAAGGCDPQLTNDSASLTAPQLCDGGQVTVTWTITDTCDTINNITAQFNLAAPSAVTYTEPEDANLEACDFEDQNAVDTAFTNWVNAQSAAIAAAGGCAPQLTNDSASISIPQLCDGGSATVTWTVTDLCETFDLSANFNLAAPSAVTYTEPSDDSSSASEFDDEDASIAQANLDADIAAWVSAQTDIINNSLAGGCSPTVTNDFTDQSILFCSSDSITITWTIEDICGTTTVDATYTFTQPEGISFTDPSDDTAEACEFDNADPVAAQAALDADIAAWVAAQTDVINNSLNGGSPTVTNDFSNQSIALCEGGSVTITWTVEDICQTETASATYTLTQPEAVTYINPSDDFSSASEFDDEDVSVAQANLDADIAAWVSAQTDIIGNSLTGGCSPTVTNNFTDQSIVFCSSDSITITWTIEDICGTTTVDATYTFTQPEGLSFTDPSDDTAEACEFNDVDPAVAQAAIGADIAAWVATQTDIINNSLNGGSPTVTNDFTGQSIALCDGGSVTITWYIEDICETREVSATYTLTEPAAIIYNEPEDTNLEACNFEDQNAVDTAFTNWVNAQSATIATAGGCDPQLTNNSASVIVPTFCEGGSVTVTWTVTDLCETFELSADFNLAPADAITYNNPENANLEACDFENQNAVDTAFTNWVNAQSAVIATAGGCAPQLTNDSTSVTVPTFCEGGSVTVTWTVTDLCETFELSADFNLAPADAIIYNQPEDANVDACNFEDQNAVDTAFSNWVNAQSAAIAVASGCDPQLTNDSASAAIPQLCDGGQVTVTWTITDTCETIEVEATFNLTAPSQVTYNDPEDINVDACDFDNEADDRNAAQVELDADIAAWVAAQTDMINNSLTGGCSPEVTNDFNGQSIDLCEGGALTITWNIVDACETTSTTATYTLTEPLGFVHSLEPANKTVDACDFDNADLITAQAALDSDIAAWVDAQTFAISSTLTGGCSPIIYSTFTDQSIDFCTGGSITIQWTIEDICERNSNHFATYTLNQPATVSYTEPSDDSSSASEFDDEDASVAQGNLDADIAAWVSAQTDIINNSLTGGCSPIVTNNFTDQSILFCSSDSITITWTIEDICGTTTVDATYTFTQPEGISFTDPSDDTAEACEFNDADPAVAQAALDADIVAWVAAQTDVINNSLNGGSPTVTNDFTDQSIVLCEGGSVTITWTIEDICETREVSATYTLTEPAAIIYNNPEDANLEACDFADQNAVDTAFTNWVNAQSAAIAIANGCAPQLTNDSASAAIPQLCDGGSVTVTWTVTDLCETFDLSAVFNLAPADAITYNQPEDTNVDACDFADQDAVDTAFTDWVNAQSAAIAAAGGCNPQLTNDSTSVTIPQLCDGGSVTVTWTITDTCETIEVEANFNLTAPTSVAFEQASLPTDITVECDSVPNAENLTASNSCGEVSVIFTEERIDDGDCVSNYTLIRTWVATDTCGTSIEHKQTITVQDTTAPVLILPANATAECSADLSPISFGTATATDNCDANPVITYVDVTTQGPCPGSISIIRTWTATDACGNSVSENQTISTSDTTPPVFVEELPEDITVECTAIPNAETLTATDNCGNANVIFNEVITNGSCANNYTISRTWTAVDECGLETSHTQLITVQDTTPPVFVESLPTDLTVECDAIPVAEVLTATDNCGNASVTVTDVQIAGSCPNAFSIERTWTATDECGLSTTHTQIIEVQDTKAPTFVESLPIDITVECDAIPVAQTLTAVDNCGEATVSVQDVKTNGDCPNSYTIARTWTAVDECGLRTSHTQIITVEDTTAPNVITSFDEVLNVSCADIPEIPSLEFEDNCSVNVEVTYEETSTYDETVYQDYQIVRTWTATDECGNTTEFSQTLNVSLDEVVTQINAEDRCYDDGIVDLNTYLAEENPNGYWELIQGDPKATLEEGGLFNPTTLELNEDFNPNSDGIDYVFRYTVIENGCISVTEVTMNINADCVVLPCGEDDVVISKALTPNGDGHNETFDIMGIDLCGFTANVKIFNRWGALIYESDNYQVGESMGGFTGRAKSSVGSADKVPNGTYYYIVTLKESGLKPFTGPLYIGTK